ncbi:MAG: cupin domain-containing protein [Candidatus Nitrosocosmicus sp.]|nr:cupin domain-containing protein [Candidatus Nitrosocosmicus sp.]
MQPKSLETFYIIEVTCEFILNDKMVLGKAGDVIFFPKETPHRFEVGHKGGHSLVISPPELEFYFFKVNCSAKVKFPMKQNQT